MNKFILFFLFIALLFLLFSRIQFTSIQNTKQGPDFVLEKSQIDHFVEGEFQFRMIADKIEIYKHVFRLSGATISFDEGVLISANFVNVDRHATQMEATSNVVVKYANVTYHGQAIRYFVKEKRFIGYNGGNLEAGGHAN